MYNYSKLIAIYIFGKVCLFVLKVKMLRRFKRIDYTSSSISRVLTISEVDKKGGAAKLAYRVHKALLSKGIKSEMLVGMVTEPESNIHLLKQRNDIFSRILHKYDSQYKWKDFFRLSSFDILKMAIYKNADLVHLHNLHVNYFSKFVLPKISAQKRIVWTLHDSLDLFEDFPDTFSTTGELQTHLDIDDSKRKTLQNLSQQIIDNSNLVIVTPSKWLYDKAKRGVFKNSDVRLIYNGVDENVFIPRDHDSVRKELGLPIDQTILLFSAAWGLTEGTKDSGSTLMEMVNHLADRNDITFVVLGGGSLNEGNNLINVPYINGDELLSKYYSAADLFIYPSLWDNCPLSVLENMGTGTPVITYNTGGIPELVRHMESGYIAKYNDSSDFIKGVDLFINDKKFLISASKLSREIFESSFTQTKMVNKYLELYNEVLHRQLN